MSRIERDSLLSGPLPLAEGERLVATFRPDRGAFIRNNLIVAVILSLVAGSVLLLLGNPHAWTGPVAAGIAVAARASFLASEALAADWRLTDRRLLGPGGRAVRLADLAAVRPFFGDVLVITRGGDKHLLKYMANGPATAAAIRKAGGLL